MDSKCPGFRKESRHSPVCFVISCMGKITNRRNDTIVVWFFIKVCPCSADDINDQLTLVEWQLD